MSASKSSPRNAPNASSANTAVNSASNPTLGSLASLIPVIAADSAMRGLLANVGQRQLRLQALDAVWPFAAAVLAQETRLMVVTPSARQAEDLLAQLRSLVGDAADLLPGWETLPHERLSPGVATVAARMKTLRRLAVDPALRIVVAPVRALLQPVQQDLPQVEPIHIAPGVEWEFTALKERLVELGYTQVDVVAKPGHFATRGGLIDIFPATEELPIRVDFWGDEISEVRPFTTGDQRTIAEAPADLEVVVYPCRELLLTDEVTEAAARAAKTYAGQPQLAEFLDKISQRMQVQGLESAIGLLRPEALVPLPELLPQDMHILLLAPEAAARRAKDLEETGQQFMEASWEIAAAGGDAPMEGVAFLSLRGVELAQLQRGGAWWTGSAPGWGLDGSGVDLQDPGELNPEDAQTFTLEYQPAPAPHGDLEAISALLNEFRQRVEAGQQVVFAAPNITAAGRMLRRLNEAGIPCMAEGFAVRGIRQARDGEACVRVFVAVAHQGLIIPFKGDDSRPELLIVTETDVTGNRVDAASTGRRKPAKKRNRVDPLALEPGDLVVHDTHGIGKFVEMTERLVGRPGEQSRREYLVLEYAPSKRGGPGDQLYVPMDQLDLLSRYVGGERPALSKMGGSDWKNTKRKARGAVREIAGELVQLYAARQAAPGYAFAPDTPWQREMEEAFPYTETEDQYQAIEAVKADMEKPVPMDRVIVGDVGYGKTEVAVRAAFKAVQSGKQVAVLVPTTLLAQQHVATFRERMQDFPTTIRELSRFTSAKESREILSGLAEGTVDIVIGTHRLLQTGVTWKNLGLIIVDEEQRFGVEHKEHIKSLRTHVDVLTMSATPIPRTLEMSMAGIREMSTILTPPQDRHPVLTYVGVQEDKHVAAAIRRELLRDGQVFYVHNRVRSIEDCAAKIRQLVPEARVVVAHGQMSEDQLETTVKGFWEREFDVLVSTTIVETGLDIANANTLIVENAHHMGLSQLHQLRGRVGRSRERGYAYFLYPRGEVLTETSYDRLTTIAQNNDLGAGMAVAMKDLEMRGAGNVLGAEQSGHIAGVGFDLYVRLVGEAVEAYRALAEGKVVDGTEEESKEIRIDLPVDAHIPADYIAAERLRLEAYRKFAEITEAAGITAVLEELQDRYGEPPVSIVMLAVLTRLRLLCRDLKVHDVVLAGQKISLSPIVLPDSGQVRLKRLFPAAQYRATTKVVLLPIPKQGAGMRAVPLAGVELVQWVADALTSLAGLPSRSMTE